MNKTPAERVRWVLTSYDAGMLALCMATSFLIDLAGTFGAEVVAAELDAEWRQRLRELGIVSCPPERVDDVLIIESVCNIEPIDPEEWRRRERERREIAFRGAWALHRALFDVSETPD